MFFFHKKMRQNNSIKCGYFCVNIGNGNSILYRHSVRSDSLLGGLVVTDNTNNELLFRNIIDKDLSILIHVPEQKNYTKNIVISDSHKFKSYVDSVFNIALDGNYLDAMTLNGMLYSEILKQSNDAAIFALKNHALAAGLSGTGPSVAAICRPGYESQILESWKSLGGDVISAKINNDKGM